MSTTANKTPMKRPALYTEFILWSAMPEGQQRALGIENQKQFAEYHSVDEATLTRWKHRPDYEERVDKILKAWSIGKTPTVVHGIYRAAVKGNPMSQLLWLQYFKNFNTKQDTDGGKGQKVEISENDFRFIVDGFPEPARTKYHGYITEIIDYGHALRTARDSEDDIWNARRTEDEVLAEADNDAQYISRTRADDMAYRYTERVCTNLERKISPHYHKSAKRWGQE